MISATGQRSLNALRRLVRALVASSHDLEQSAGITSAQRFVLEQLLDGPLPSVNALAARTHTSQATVSTVLTRLERRDFIARRPDPDDRRRTTVTLTPTGRQLLTRGSSTVQSRLAAAQAAMPHRQARQLAGALEAWVAAAGLGRTKVTMFLEPDQRTRRRRKHDA